MAQSFEDLGGILVVIPTYNELENLPKIIARVRQSVPEAHILVADDNSPDGTAQVADEIAAGDDHVHVMHRLGKEGLGAAYLAGFSWALENGFDVVVEMDADGSHQPEQLPLLLDALRDADLVLGSRYVPGGSVVNWPKSREWLSRGGNWYTRRALQIPLQDATGGYRAFRASTLRALDLDGVGSAGYIFQVDLAYRRAVQRQGLAQQRHDSHRFVTLDGAEGDDGVAAQQAHIDRLTGLSHYRFHDGTGLAQDTHLAHVDLAELQAANAEPVVVRGPILLDVAPRLQGREQTEDVVLVELEALRQLRHAELVRLLAELLERHAAHGDQRPGEHL